ncbi:hypothetical protein K439DRAFT_1406625 [Ramaria rubella]|nr:hypothetical protein K439DRAFT_1406625 [Ramaria rubella]
MSSNWLIAHISKPTFVWGARHRGHVHECPNCHILLLTGERPGFCCGPNGNRLNDVRPLPPFPPEFDVFLHHPDISKLSHIFNLVYSFASLESTAEFPSFDGPPGFFAVEGKLFHRVRPTHQDSCVQWLLYDGMMHNYAPHHRWIDLLPIAWRNAMNAALLRINPFASQLHQLYLTDHSNFPNAQLILNEDNLTNEMAAIINFSNTSEGQIRSRTMVIAKRSLDDEEPLSSRNRQIHVVSRMWEPLAYPLLFPHGTLGWGITERSNKIELENADINDRDDSNLVLSFSTFT